MSFTLSYENKTLKIVDGNYHKDFIIDITKTELYSDSNNNFYLLLCGTLPDELQALEKRQITNINPTPTRLIIHYDRNSIFEYDYLDYRKNEKKYVFTDCNSHAFVKIEGGFFVN